MSNQKSAPNLMASGFQDAQRDSTRILSKLSSDSRVVPARAKKSHQRNKIFWGLTVLVVLTGATTWFIQRLNVPVSTPSLAISAATLTDTPRQAEPDLLSTMSEPQTAQIVNEPEVNGIKEKEAVHKIVTSANPSTVLTPALPENLALPQKTNDISPAKNGSKADQPPAAKNAQPASRSRKVEDDTDVTLLAALLQNTKSPASIKKPVPQKTPTIAERLKSCQRLEKQASARCRQKICKGKVGKNSACQKFVSEE